MNKPDRYHSASRFPAATSVRLWTICALIVATQVCTVRAVADKPGDQPRTETKRSTRTERSTDPRLRNLFPRQSASPPAIPPQQADEAVLSPYGLDRPVNPDTYVVGPSDEFILIIHGGEESRISLRVLPEGNVILPNAGPLRAAGLTITALRARTREALASYYPGAKFNLELLVPRTFVVHVLGEVKRPGAVELHVPFRLGMAIDAVGGFTRQASHRRVSVVDADGVRKQYDLQRYLRFGNLADNPVLHEGQSVVVSTRGPACTVIGELWHNGVYEVLPGESIADMIALTGGPTPNSALGRIVLERFGDSDSLRVEHMTYSDCARVKVQGRDTIVIPDRRTFPGHDYVRVEGGQGREGRIVISRGETLGDFVPRFIRLGDKHDLAHAVVERHSRGRKVQFIPVDLRDIVKGKDPGALRLESGDVISIPVRDDQVYVTGHVAAPGAVSFQRGLPAGRYIALAGGPESNGSIDRIDIYDVDGNRRGGNRDAEVFRGETIVVKRTRTSIFGSAFVGLTTITSLVLSIVAVTR